MYSDKNDPVALLIKEKREELIKNMNKPKKTMTIYEMLQILKQRDASLATFEKTDVQFIE